MIRIPPDLQDIIIGVILFILGWFFPPPTGRKKG